MGQTREQAVTETFVDLADTLVRDYDIGEFLHLLVERCQDVLQVDAGGVLLESPDGTLNLAAATAGKMERLEETEMRYSEGPCFEAYRDSKQVVAHDLESTLEQWPHAAKAALDMGLRSVYAFPLRLRDDCIGALNLYREHPGPFGDSDIGLAQAFADVAAIGILQQRQVVEAKTRADQLQGALNTRVVIEQAKGVLAAKTGVTPDEAFQALRNHARNNRMNVHKLAVRVVEAQSAELTKLGSPSG